MRSIFSRAPRHSLVLLKIFCLRREDDELVGVIFYSWSPISRVGRKAVFGRMLTIKEVNETLATISRVVMHPKYRSIGLGEKLVKDTLPLVGRPYVEEKRKLILLSIPFVGINLLKPRIKPLGSSPYSFFQFPLLGLTF